MTEPSCAVQQLLHQPSVFLEGAPIPDNAPLGRDQQTKSALVEMWSRLKSVVFPEKRPADQQSEAALRRMSSNFDGRIEALTKECSALQEAVASCAILDRQIGLLAQCPVALLGFERAQEVNELREECKGKRFVFEDRLIALAGERRLFERAVVGIRRERVSSTVLEALVRFERGADMPGGCSDELEAAVYTPIREMHERLTAIVQELAERASAPLRQVRAHDAQLSCSS